MVILMEARPSLMRVTVTLDALDVDLLDRLAALEDSNRSAELRSMLEQVRPMLLATVEAFEGAQRQRAALDGAAGQVELSKLSQLLPEAERLNEAYLGAMSRIEGLAAADGDPLPLSDSDPRPSNHGGHTPTPEPTPTTPVDD